MTELKFLGGHIKGDVLKSIEGKQQVEYKPPYSRKRILVLHLISQIRSSTLT